MVIERQAQATRKQGFPQIPRRATLSSAHWRVHSSLSAGCWLPGPGLPQRTLSLRSGKYPLKYLTIGRTALIFRFLLFLSI